jgi:hypothetical protein
MTSHRTLREGLSIVYLIYIHQDNQKGEASTRAQRLYAAGKKKKNEVSQEKEKKKSRTRQEGREKEE